MFRDAVEHVLQTRTSDDMAKFILCNDAKDTEVIFPTYLGKWCGVDGADSCLEFLDYYFTYCVEWSPNGMVISCSMLHKFHF